jgi:hypothetical protein
MKFQTGTRLVKFVLHILNVTLSCILLLLLLLRSDVIPEAVRSKRITSEARPRFKAVRVGFMVDKIAP